MKPPIPMAKPGLGAAPNGFGAFAPAPAAGFGQPAPQGPQGGFIGRMMDDPVSMMGLSLLANSGPSLTPKTGFEGLPATMAVMQRNQMLKQDRELRKEERDRAAEQREAQAAAMTKLGIDPNLPAGIQSAMWKAQQPQTPDVPTSVQEYLYAQSDPGFLEHQRQLAEAKSTKINNNMNVDQGKAAGFADRVANANRILEEVQTEGTSIYNNVANEIPGIGNFLTEDNFKIYDQARRDFVNATLRRESGAVISPSEFANAERQYFPQPGDTKEVIEQKRKNRELILRGMERAAGPSYERPSIPGLGTAQPAEASQKRIQDMSDEELEAIVNGQ